MNYEMRISHVILSFPFELKREKIFKKKFNYIVTTKYALGKGKNAYFLKGK